MHGKGRNSTLMRKYCQTPNQNFNIFPNKNSTNYRTKTPQMAKFVINDMKNQKMNTNHN